MNYINCWATCKAYTCVPLIFIYSLFYVIYYLWIIASNTLYLQNFKEFLHFSKSSQTVSQYKETWDCAQAWFLAYLVNG